MMTLHDRGLSLDSQEQRVVVLAINTLGDGGRPWPDAESIQRIDADYVRICLERTVRYAGDVGIADADVHVARALIARM